SNTKWCSAPDCDYEFVVDSSYIGKIQCRCGRIYESCLQCGHEDHFPLPCDMIKRWISTCEEKSSSNWVSCHTKNCPGCHKPIEKNAGCIHMTCKHEGCKKEFCWNCLGDWEKHTSYICNKPSVALTQVKKY